VGGSWALAGEVGLSERWQKHFKNCPEKLHNENTETKALHA